MYRYASKKAKQKTPMMCYAAAFESWMATIPGRLPMSQDDIAEDYGDPNIKGGAPEKKLIRLLNEHGLDFVHWKNGSVSLTEALVEDALRKSHAVLVYKSSVHNSHTLVIYGVSHANGPAQISYMDPWYGEYRWSSLNEFDGKPWLLAWKK